MFRYSITDKLQAEIKEAAIASPSITNRLEEMAENPLARAKKTGIPLIGEYYVNSGRYCLLFDVEPESEKIIIRAIVFDHFLHKILKGKIPIPERLEAKA